MDTQANTPDRARIPWDAHIFGWGPILPFLVALLVVWLGPDRMDAVALRGATLWGACIVIFAAGVRRGFSFALHSGPKPHVLAEMTGLFGAAALSLVLVPPLGAVLLALAFAALAVLDPLAARRGEAPRWFARLRPVQMAIPAVCLVGLAVM
ncbi:DUF3429 domain-containing protein [Palleronia abyssalis]|uniref:DUF3429 domain-containing protein n=1 Tax=Palleronia abyssalis TaxID=1501240 RepID=A0A2R8BU29_9RHOB|nr:DUF3429 domain-containing protein [Palleronia abyssalis]SPJ23648.1 hypothetical protein PAA8504_01461 [Palleronia abyssalis]